MNSSVDKFLKSNNVGTQLIEEYIPICNKILYTNPSVIQDVTEKLKQNIKDYATKNSRMYADNIREIYSRIILSKEHWFVDDLKSEIQIFSTSGSSTGYPFAYGIWNKYIPFLENECHYGMILDEFSINKNNPRILILKKLSYNPIHQEFLYQEKGFSPYTLHTHKSIDSTRYFVNFDSYMDNPNMWVEKLLSNIKDLVPFDIIMITGPIMNILVNYLKQNNIKIYIGNLMSQTGELMRQSDKQDMIDNGYVNHVCDHMRCWDGGATFFTCKYDTYHLLDNLTWCTQGRNNELISTDYLSMPAPFINYWNGDLCEIKNEYQLCLCGRYYRPFKILQSRPFALKGPTKLTQIKEKISQLSFKTKINQIQFENLTVNVYSTIELTTDEKYTINNILIDYTVNYYF